MRLGDVNLDLLTEALYHESRNCMRRGSSSTTSRDNRIIELTAASVLGSIVTALNRTEQNMREEAEREMRRRMEQDTGEQP